MGRDSSRSLMPRWAWIALGVAALAGLILGISAVSAPRTEPRRSDVATSTVPAETPSELLAKARAALESGDATSAVLLIGRALVLDPNNAEARRMRDDISGSTEPTVAPVPANAWLAAYPVRSLLPTRVTGYALGAIVAIGADAEVAGQPQAASTADGRIQRLQLAAHDRGTAAGASAFIDSVSKKVYTRDVTTADINGAKAYVATDGTRLAVVAFVRGRYAFEVVATTVSEPPSAIRDLTVAVARAFPASP